MTADNYAELVKELRDTDGIHSQADRLRHRAAAAIKALVEERDTRQRDAEYWKARYDGAITLERKRNAETEAELARVREALVKIRTELRGAGPSCSREFAELAMQAAWRIAGAALAGKGYGEKHE